MDNNFSDDIVKSYVLNDPHSINHVLEGIYELYSSDSGWVVDEPVITPNRDNKTVTIRVHVEKHEMSKGRGR